MRNDLGNGGGGGVGRNFHDAWKKEGRLLFRQMFSECGAGWSLNKEREREQRETSGLDTKLSLFLACYEVGIM